MGLNYIIFLQYIVSILSVVYPLLLILYSIIAINVAADNIFEECLTCLARMPPPSEGPYETLMLFRLMKVVQQRPCELRVLGYRFESSDPLKIFGGIAAAQLVSFMGLSFIFGG